MQTRNLSRHDVVVVGARVAGAATAMLLARLGHDVVVLEQASFPSDTVSTHSIGRSGVVQLRRWGLLDAVLASGAPAIRQVSFHAGGVSLTRMIKDKAGVDLVVAPRRYLLDSILATAAVRAGAQLRLGVTVTGLVRDGHGRVVGVLGRDHAGAGVDIGARHVIGADGLGSRVARLVGAAINQVGPAGGATQYAYWAGIPWNGIEFFVAPRSFAGVFPTHGGQACRGETRPVWPVLPGGIVAGRVVSAVRLVASRAGLVRWTGLPKGLPTHDVAALYASHAQQLW